MTTLVGTRTPALREWLKEKHPIAALLLLVSCLGPLLWISRYNYPAGDDYLAFFQAQNLGPFRATHWWYRYWTGRYSSFFLQSLFAEHATWLAAYRVVPVILLLMGFASLFCFVKVLFGPNFRSRELFTVSAVGYVFLVGLTPEVSTGFYWLPTNVQYLGAVFITLLLLALYIDLGRGRVGWRRGLYWLAIIPLIAVLAGLNEISIALFIAIIAVSTVVHALKFRRVSGAGLVILGVSVLFALLSFLAPGNSIRAEYIVAKQISWIATLSPATTLTLTLWAGLLTSTPLVPVSFLYVVFLAGNLGRLRELEEALAGVRWHWTLVLLLATSTGVNMALFSAAGIHAVPDRVNNVAIYSLALGWFFLVTVLFLNATAAGVGFSTRTSLIRGLGAAASVLLILFLATGFEVTVDRGPAAAASGHGRGLMSRLKTKSVYANAYLDVMSGRATGYALQSGETTRRYRAAHGDCVVFPSLSEAPTTITIPFVKYPWRWCPKEYLRRFERRHRNAAHFDGEEGRRPRRDSG